MGCFSVIRGYEISEDFQWRKINDCVIHYFRQYFSGNSVFLFPSGKSDRIYRNKEEMTKKFILNLLLNLGIVFLVLSAWAGYNSGQLLYLGISVALLVVLIYLKVVLLKQVNRDVRAKQEEKARLAQQEMKRQKKRAK